MEQTLSIIKPDAVAKNVIGQIYSRFENAGFKIVASKMIHLDKEMAGGFYAVHKDRPFFNDLMSFMTSGPVMTIRADFAESLDENAVHGSDSLENAAIEIAYFFGEDGVCPRTR